MRAPGIVRQLVAEVGEGIGFPVCCRAECGADSGQQIGGGEPFGDERVMQPGDFPGQLRDVIDQRGNGLVALIADVHAGQFERDRGEDLVLVDRDLRYVPGRVRLLVQWASAPQVGGS